MLLLILCVHNRTTHLESGPLLSTLFIVTHFVLMIILWVRNNYCLHFIDEENEAQRGSERYPWSHRYYCGKTEFDFRHSGCSLVLSP